MATSLVQDTFLYTHPAAQTWYNVRYGDDHVDQRMHVFRNSVRVSGGNPVFFATHGGSWSANSAADFVAGVSSGSLGRFPFSYLLDSSTYGTTEYFDVVAPMYSCHSHERIPNAYPSTDYDVLAQTVGGNYHFLISYPTYGRAIDDLQRCWQFCADNATHWGWDPNRFVALGHSVGGNTTLCAAFSPSRPWSPRSQGRYQARSPARVCGVVNWSAEVNLDPWFMYHQHARYLRGKVERSVVNIRADIERDLLNPDPTTGLYPSGSTKTALCKKFSPVDVITQFANDRQNVRIHSSYLRNFGLDQSGEETLSNQGNYTSIPPYNASGHDWRQFAVIEATCVSVGIQHSGSVDNAANIGNGDGVDSGIPGLQALKYAYEQRLAPLYAFASACIN